MNNNNSNKNNTQQQLESPYRVAESLELITRKQEWLKKTPKILGDSDESKKLKRMTA